MATRSIVRLAALAFGMYLVLEALSTASFLIVDNRSGADGILYLAAAVPVVGAFVMATILYVYSGRASVNYVESEPWSLAQVAIKLFGLYLFVRSIPLIVGGAFSISPPSPQQAVDAAAYQSLSIGVVYVLVGSALFVKSEWLIRKVSGGYASP